MPEAAQEEAIKPGEEVTMQQAAVLLPRPVPIPPPERPIKRKSGDLGKKIRLLDRAILSKTEELERLRNADKCEPYEQQNSAFLRTAQGKRTALSTRHTLISAHFWCREAMDVLAEGQMELEARLTRCADDATKAMAGMEELELSFSQIHELQHEHEELTEKVTNLSQLLEQREEEIATLTTQLTDVRAVLSPHVLPMCIWPRCLMTA